MDFSREFGTSDCQKRDYPAKWKEENCDWRGKETAESKAEHATDMCTVAHIIAVAPLKQPLVEFADRVKFNLSPAFPAPIMVALTTGHVRTPAILLCLCEAGRTVFDLGRACPLLQFFVPDIGASHPRMRHCPTIHADLLAALAGARTREIAAGFSHTFVAGDARTPL